MSNSFLVVVIVNYKTPELTIDCLYSVAKEIPSLEKIKVIVTDNASGDDSVEKIQKAIETEGWQEWVSMMPLEKNGGFAYGNNAAFRVALESSPLPDYLLLLNPDTVVRPGAFKALVDFMDKHPEVGIAGSRLENPDGTPQVSAFRFETILSELDKGFRLGIISKLLSKWTVWCEIPEENCQTDWVSGASMMVRRIVFEDIGLLDEEFFMYYEESDFCLRARKAGWSCWYVPESRVIHLVGQSSGVGDRYRPVKPLPQYWFDSRKRYFVKNHGLLYTGVADIAHIVGLLTWNIRKKIQQKPDTDPPNLLSGLISNSVFTRVFKNSSNG